MIELFGGNEVIKLKQWKFPAGERGITILETEKIELYKNFTVKVNFTGSDDLIDMVLLVNAIRHIYSNTHLRLCIPYFPYSRQDRVASPGDAFALQAICQIINSCNFWEVETWDAHSEVLLGLFAPGVLKNVPQHILVNNIVSIFKDDTTALISPDAGASKKIYKLAKKLGLPVVEANKFRDTSTGNLLGCNITDTSAYSRLIVVDDICDGGSTFIQLANAIKDSRDNTPYTINLVTTHGIYSKGKDLLYDHYFNVVCINDMRKDTNV